MELEGIGKQYVIGAAGPGYQTLRDSLAHTTRRILRPRRGAARDKRTFWALSDVSVTVNHGDVLGVVGRNGAGKSTLLKLLSKITPPTVGTATIHGRVGSLLEVGTGFHPELTGRENVYLNGSVLGMRRSEISRKFDAIVDFAGVDQFLDTPVKRYSSGMYVRLAFAVAAHLEPEILLVDEVLAVGDQEFQKKCLNRMNEIGQEGRTVVFVSHAMSAVQALCSRAIVLERGRLTYDGTVDGAVARYTGARSGQAMARQDLQGVLTRTGNGAVRLTAFWAEDESGMPTTAVLNGAACSMVMQYSAPAPLPRGVVATLLLRNSLGLPVFYHHNLLTGDSLTGAPSAGEFVFSIPRLPLRAGEYSADISLSTDNGHTVLDAISGVELEVVDGDFFGTGALYTGGAGAPVLIDGTWRARERSA